MGILDFLSSLGQEDKSETPNALSRFGTIAGRYINNPALQNLAAMDTQNKNESHLAKVFAANPAYAQRLYGAKSDLARLSSGGKDQKFASIELANEIQKARASGDTQRLNDLLIASKALDKGVIQSADGTATTMNGYPSVLGQLQYGKETGTQIAKTENEPARAGMVRSAELNQDLALKPDIAAATTAADMAAKAATDKQLNFPQKAAAIDQNIEIIDKALAKPGFDKNFGLSGQIPNIPGSEAADAATYIKQIGGTAFLTAIGEMRGSGSISEREGEAATSAVARLQNSQSAKSAREALGDLRKIMAAAKSRAAPSGVQNIDQLSPISDMEFNGGASPMPNAPFPSMGPQQGAVKPILKYNRATGGFE